MSAIRILILTMCFALSFQTSFGQNNYFFPANQSFDAAIPSPEAYLGYAIGSHHTRHDMVVNYMKELARLSDKAAFIKLGETYEHRVLFLLQVTDPSNTDKLEDIRQKQLQRCDPSVDAPNNNGLPIIINLGYNVHGNEPSSTESAMLMAYYLVAGKGPTVEKYLKESVIFIDPVINPDGRDRHSHWANMHKGSPMVADPLDREHNERWPSGRTNHYWFDLNRDWLLLVHPEMQNKMRWYHTWYPNVVTDFHEMGSSASYFFEPPKMIGSKDPIMPKENYIDLNNLFGDYFHEAMDSIGSLYFTKEVFDGTYPGYGSSYPDLQGGLGLLFEQASSRGHVQKTSTVDITFPFTIRNQLISGITTVKAAVENKTTLFDYQRMFFETAISNAAKDPAKAYVFGDVYDQNRNRAFIDMLLQHKIEVYELDKTQNINNQTFEAGSSWIVPTSQPQYRMVQTMFETYTEYRDSVFYDASAWSLVHSYGMPHGSLTSRTLPLGKAMTKELLSVSVPVPQKSAYAYVFSWNDYYAPKALYHLLSHGVLAKSSFKPFSIEGKSFDYGSIIVSVQQQNIDSDSLYTLIKQASEAAGIEIHAISSGYVDAGVDFGSRYVSPVKLPKAIVLVGRGVSAYEAGELWFQLDSKLNMPITKLDFHNLGRVNLNDYTVMVLVSGNYGNLSDAEKRKIQSWVRGGGTLITQRQATQYVIRDGWVKEKLVTATPDTSSDRKPYVLAPEIEGAKAIGGTIFEVDIDTTHPLAFGYHRKHIPVYRNSSVMLEPSKSPYSTVAQYTEKPLISGYISEKNHELLGNTAALVVSSMGRGKVILFTDNMNFRATWYGTSKLFFNALFFGGMVRTF